MKFKDDGEFSITAAQQKSTETNVGTYHTVDKLEESHRAEISLKRAAHITYLMRGLAYLNCHYQSLDASQPWIVYWILNSLDLLGCIPDPDDSIDPKARVVSHETLSDTVKFLASCVDRFVFY